jgi:hypothetical protein
MSAQCNGHCPIQLQCYARNILSIGFRQCSLYPGLGKHAANLMSNSPCQGNENIRDLMSPEDR